MWWDRTRGEIVVLCCLFPENKRWCELCKAGLMNFPEIQNQFRRALLLETTTADYKNK